MRRWQIKFGRWQRKNWGREDRRFWQASYAIINSVTQLHISGLSSLALRAARERDKKKMAKSRDFKVDLEELLEAGAHFGHQSRRWNPKMEEYIWDERDDVHVFDLAVTAQKIEEACQFLYDQARQGKDIVMVGTKRQAEDIVKEEAERAGVYYVTERWLGGTITNWKQIKTRIEKLLKMKEEREAGEYEKYTHKEQVLLDREIDRLERFFGGLVGLEEIPDILFVVDTLRERVAVREANQRGVTVVGIVDSNADPELVDYVIPANDDAVRTVKLIVQQVGEALYQGRKEWEKKQKGKKKKEKEKKEK